MDGLQFFELFVKVGTKRLEAFQTRLQVGLHLVQSSEFFLD